MLKVRTNASRVSLCAQTDIWSLGIVLYQLLTLKHPFEAKSLVALIHNIMTRNPDPVPSNYSPELRSLALALLRKDVRVVFAATLRDMSDLASVTQPSKRPSAKEVLDMPFMRPHVEHALRRARQLRHKLPGEAPSVPPLVVARSSVRAGPAAPMLPQHARREHVAITGSADLTLPYGEDLDLDDTNCMTRSVEFQSTALNALLPSHLVSPAEFVSPDAPPDVLHHREVDGDIIAFNAGFDVDAGAGAGVGAGAGAGIGAGAGVGAGASTGLSSPGMPVDTLRQWRSTPSSRFTTAPVLGPPPSLRDPSGQGTDCVSSDSHAHVLSPLVDPTSQVLERPRAPTQAPSEACSALPSPPCGTDNAERSVQLRREHILSGALASSAHARATSGGVGGVGGVGDVIPALHTVTIEQLAYVSLDDVIRAAGDRLPPHWEIRPTCSGVDAHTIPPSAQLDPRARVDSGCRPRQGVPSSPVILLRVPRSFRSADIPLWTEESPQIAPKSSNSAACLGANHTKKCRPAFSHERHLRSSLAHLAAEAALAMPDTPLSQQFESPSSDVVPRISSIPHDPGGGNDCESKQAGVLPSRSTATPPQPAGDVMRWTLTSLANVSLDHMRDKQ